MAETIGTYYFQIAPSADGVGKDVEDMLNGSDSIGGVADSLSGTFAGALGAAGAAMAAVTAAAGIMVGAIVEAGDAFLDAATSAAEYGDNVDKMSQKMGISAEAYQEWEAVMQHSGTSMETLKASMKTMANAAQKGNEAFQALGITEEEVATLSQEDLFGRVIEGLQGMEEGTERTYLAGQLLGRGATELGALLNTSAEDTQAMKDRLHELGGVMSDEDVKAAAAFQDSLQDMTTGFDSLQRNLVSGFLPSMSQVMDGVSDIFAGDTDKGLENISAGIESFLGNIGEVAPKIMETGAGLVSTLAQSIMTNLPTLITIGGEQIVALMSGMSQNFPAIMEAVQNILSTLMTTLGEVYPQILPMGFELMRTIVQGVSEALPELIPMAAELFATLWSAISEFVPQVPELGITILTALADGLIAALPAIIETVPLIIGSYVQYMIGMLPLIIEAGTTLLTALVSDGNLHTIIGALVDCIPAIIDAIIVAILDAIPLLVVAGFELLVALIANLPEITMELIAGVGDLIDALLMELANLIVKFEDIGEQIMMGLADGIVAAGDAVVSTATSVLDKLPQGAKDLFKINSPSKLFEGYGEYIDMGLALGIEENADVPQSAMTSMARDVSTAFSPATSETTINNNGSESGDTYVFPIYIGQERLDEMVINSINRANYKSGGRS